MFTMEARLDGANPYPPEIAENVLKDTPHGRCPAMSRLLD
jgi:hypothetical protein